MSGPPGPPYGSTPDNVIGEFTIGVSQIGSIGSLLQHPFDIWLTIISQYANSPILTRLITNFAAYIDQTQNFDAFFDNVMNILTAQGHGLDVWGRIVGVTRTISVPNSNQYFGFEEATDAFGFNQAPFFQGQPLTDNFQLSDSAFRTLILAKGLSNISDGSIKSINQVLLNLFPGRGNCYVVDGNDMTMAYKFEFALSAVELAIVSSSGALPRPTGVSATVITP